MQNNNFQVDQKLINGKSGGLAYTFSAAIPLIFQILIMLLSIFICGLIGINYEDAQGSDAYIWALMFFNQFAFLWVVILFVRRNRLNALKAYGISRRGAKGEYIALGIVFTVALAFFMTPIVNWFVELLMLMGYTPGDSLIPDLSKVHNYLLAVLIIGALPAICEELVFRGTVARSLRGFGSIFAILMSSLLFAIMHQSVEQLVHQFIFGAALCYVMLRTGSVITSMVMHFTNNFLILTLEFLGGFFPVLTEVYWQYAAMAIGGAIVAAIVIYEFAVKKRRAFDKSKGCLSESTDSSMFFIYALFGIIFNVIMLVVGLFL